MPVNYLPLENSIIRQEDVKINLKKKLNVIIGLISCLPSDGLSNSKLNAFTRYKVGEEDDTFVKN